MMSMQRSLSSPPPASPSISYRTPSVFPTEQGVHTSRHFRHSSRSPTRGLRTTDAIPHRRSEEVPRSVRGVAQEHHVQTLKSSPAPASRTTPPVVANLSSQIANQMFPQAFGAPRTAPPNPLLSDVSSYKTPSSPQTNETTSLQELAHLVRLSRYQERKRANTRTRLERTLISTALNARLTRCGQVAYRNLIESFRRDDKDSFAVLYNAIQDVRKSCDELRRYALLEPDMEAQSSPILGSSESLDMPDSSTAYHGISKATAPFLHGLSTSSRDVFLQLLTQIRTNPNYLAAMLCALSSSELNALLHAHKGLETVESVLPFQSRLSSRHHSNASVRNGISDVERLLSFQRHDALSILIHTCFANSAGPDSSEDQRRTDIWATALAQLISEPKSTSEHFLICILNSWTMMRDWSGKSKMEWYLMKILADGAFLLDRAEDQHGTRFNVSDWSQSDEEAARNFYDNALTKLFELVDDDDGTGIPEGLLELGNAVLNKLDSKYIDNTSRWLVWRCLFFVFFLGVIVHPESHGLLSEYYITPYAREKILKKVAMKAHEYVSGMWTGKSATTSNPVEIPQHIKVHIESILARFQGSRSKSSATRLLPARSITSLRETAEVHPYLLVSPADLVTLVNALFPERRPLSATSGSMRSTAASFSGLQTAAQAIPTLQQRSSLENASLMSTSVSSVSSDANTSRDGLSGDPTHPNQDRRSPISVEPELQGKLNNYEDDGYRLRLALHEMTRTLGSEVTRGSCHPCADLWSVLFISPNGSTMTTRMTYDVEEEPDADDISSISEFDDRGNDDDLELNRDYHQLRDSVLQLVEDYEIPRDLEPEPHDMQFTNRASQVGKYRTKQKASQQQAPNVGSQTATVSLGAPPAPVGSSPEPVPVLISMLNAAYALSRSQADFVASHLHWRTLSQLQNLSSPSLRKNGYAALINIFSRGPRDSISKSAAAIEEFEAWLVWLKQSQERLEGLIDRMMRKTRLIRDKMWYIADVRNSKEYTHSRDVCQALKVMGMPQRWRSLQRSRSNTARGQGPSYLYRTESQIIDLLAASEDNGGPNKLSDDQAEMTTMWLRQFGIENFCQGEERIHRFCCEIDKCISKLVGDNIRDAPVLWSSELYKRDKAVYDRLKAQGRERAWSSDDSSSIWSDPQRPNSAHMRRHGAVSSDARSVGIGSIGNQSHDAGRLGHLRSTVPISDILEGQEYFDRASPVHTIDSSNTFWSPFQPNVSPGSRAYSPTTSVTNLSTTFSGPVHYLPSRSHSSTSTGRPATSASSNETVYQQYVDDDKTRFLSELRQSLTGLLLSDLGNLLLAHGSETDQWFQKLGQECIDRKDALERHALRKSALRDVGNQSSSKPRALEKKKSFDDLRSAGENSQDRDNEWQGRDSPKSAVDASVNAMHLNDSAAFRRAARAKTSPDFPFKKAYQRLLTMFCVHPNPYHKLNALRELEHLIVASVSMRKGVPRNSRKESGTSPTARQGFGTSATVLDEAITNMKEKRRQSAQLMTNSHTTRAKTVRSSAVTDLPDMVTEEFLKLFRSASLRPSSLFRDLQLIASVVPSSTLNRPDKSKAFWNAGLAALKLKSEVCRTMVEMADEVLAAHTQSRNSTYNGGSTESTGPSATGTPPPPSTKYKLKDVGKMWSITAREGYPTAQRELALFYLSNPESVDRTILPLSKPREVFKQTVMDKYGRSERARVPTTNQSTMGPPGSAARSAQGDTTGLKDLHGSPGKIGDVRNDPGLMCVAVHWMEAAEQGGDELAMSFLRQNEFMGRA